MAWDPTHPPTGSGVVSAGLRDNFAVLDTLLVAPLTALANGQVLYKAAGPVIAGVPASTNGYVLTLVGGVPLWQPAAPAYPLLAPDGTPTAPSYSFTDAPNVGLSAFDYDDGGIPRKSLRFTAGPPRGLGGLEFFGYGTSVAAGQGYEFTIAGEEAGTRAYVGLWEETGANELYIGGGAAKLTLWADASFWTLLTTGTWSPGEDNTYDLGEPTHPIRSLYLGTSLTYTALAVAPAMPAAGHVITYAKTDKKLYQKDDAGVETALGGGGGVSAVRLPLEQATLPDGTTGNVPPEFVREKSTGTLSGAPSPTRTYARFAGDSAAVMESLMWSFLLPSNYGSGGTIRLKWKAAVATTGAVIWKAGAAPVTDGSTDDDAVAFTAVTTASASTAPATQGQSVEVTLALTTTGFAALRWLTVFLSRDPVAAADTMTGTGTAGDAILMGVQFEYTPA